MSRLTDDGGPAFPCDVADPHVGGPQQHDGMTLRDYFAAKSIPTSWSACLLATDLPATDQVADLAYRFADSMLKARQK
jgi:hypothetical protein